MWSALYIHCGWTESEAQPPAASLIRSPREEGRGARMDAPRRRARAGEAGTGWGTTEDAQGARRAGRKCCHVGGTVGGRSQRGVTVLNSPHSRSRLDGLPRVNGGSEVG